MGSGPGRPVKTHGPPRGSGSAAHIEPTSYGPRPCPAHQIFRAWAAARPGPSNFRGWAAARPISSHFQFFTARPGPARPINFFKVSARPGRAHHIFKRLGPTRPGPSQVSDRPGPARPRQPAHDMPWYLRVFVLVTRPPPKIEHGLFAPVFTSIIVIVIVFDFFGGVFGSVTIIMVIVIVTRSRSYFGLIVPKRFWFRYTLIYVSA